MQDVVITGRNERQPIGTGDFIDGKRNYDFIRKVFAPRQHKRFPVASRRACLGACLRSYDRAGIKQTGHLLDKTCRAWWPRALP